ncbi:hypothetical protein [Roseovarius sp. D0-M9]|uniref:hypothetical protein n=1 Tax=Roseovarius sp. D0-M9 TaxID=3127117 RepID=UPI00300F7CBA
MSTPTAKQYAEALTPSAETKAAYMGEFTMPFPMVEDDGEEYVRMVNVPWTTIKKIMAEIKTRAETHPQGDPVEEAAKVLLECWDAAMAGERPDAHINLAIGAAFGAAAYDHADNHDQGAAAMIRALLLGITDPFHSDLDYLRANAITAISKP